MVIIGFTFAACGGNEDEGGNGGGSISIPENDVQVYNKDGTQYTGSGTVRWRDANSGEYVDIGTVTNGKLTLDLPSTVAEKYLRLNCDTLSSVGISVSTQGARATDLFMNGLSLYNGNTEYSGIAYGTETGKKEFQIKYVYFEKPVSMNGKYGAGSYASYTFRINAKAGWNRVLAIWDYSNPSSTPVTATTNSKDIPSKMKWSLSK
jgi:hypothetical protein